MEEPADYRDMPALQERNIRVDPELIQFYLDFQMSDMLGQIANAHVALADQHPQGAASKECKLLAHLHAIAVRQYAHHHILFAHLSALPPSHGCLPCLPACFNYQKKLLTDLYPLRFMCLCLCVAL